MVRIDLKTLSAVIISMLIAIINIPVLSRIFGGAGILALLFLVFAINHKEYLTQGTIYIKVLFAALLYCAFETIYEILGISEGEYVNYYYTFSFFMIAALGPLVIIELDKKQQNIILFSYIATFVYISATNFNLREQYGNRYVRLGDYLSGTNVVSTQFFAAVALLCGVLFVLVMYSNRHKAILIFVLAYSIIFVAYVGQRMIVIISLVSLLFFQYILNERKSIVNLAFAIVGFLSVLWLMTNLQSVLSWISSLTDNIRIVRRINQIQYVLQNSGAIEGTGGSLEARINLALNSLNTFTSTPLSLLFGIGEHSKSNLLIGHHSQWIDQLAKYGIMGTALLIYSLRKSIKGMRIAMELNNTSFLYRQFFVLQGFILFRGFIGGVLYPYMSIVNFIILPILLVRVRDSE